VPPIEPFRIVDADPVVQGLLHRPQGEAHHGLVLAHGAGSNANAPLLVALAEMMASRGMTVLRCNLPYRQKRSFGPPGPGDAAQDRAGLKNAIEVMRELVGARVFLGGHSYGGRQATMLCAEEPGLVEGLLLLSYPLHPPRKPDQMRTQHLPKLTTDALFVHGTRDPFGSIPEMEQTLRLIPARTRLIEMEGAGHELTGKKSGALTQATIRIVGAFEEFYQAV